MRMISTNIFVQSVFNLFCWQIVTLKETRLSGKITENFKDTTLMHQMPKRVSIMQSNVLIILAISQLILLTEEGVFLDFPLSKCPLRCTMQFKPFCASNGTHEENFFNECALMSNLRCMKHYKKYHYRFENEGTCYNIKYLGMITQVGEIGIPTMCEQAICDPRKRDTKIRI